MSTKIPRSPLLLNRVLRRWPDYRRFRFLQKESDLQFGIAEKTRSATSRHTLSVFFGGRSGDAIGKPECFRREDRCNARCRNGGICLAMHQAGRCGARPSLLSLPGTGSGGSSFLTSLRQPRQTHRSSVRQSEPAQATQTSSWIKPFRLPTFSLSTWDREHALPDSQGGVVQPGEDTLLDDDLLHRKHDQADHD
jgi:hypothetical protein